MIAALPMYDWPETAHQNNQLWARFAARLKQYGFEAPVGLTRSDELNSLWLSPDLLLAQTCSYPLETSLKGKVKYVATPSYPVRGCETPGFYRSAIIRKGNLPNAPLPEHKGAVLPAFSSNEVIAANGFDSMSGYHALLRDIEALGFNLPEQQLLSGSHRQSIIAVANGKADLAAIDCVSWNMACKYELASQHVYVAGWTKERPGLPLITAITCSDELLSTLKSISIELFSAVTIDVSYNF